MLGLTAFTPPPIPSAALISTSRPLSIPSQTLLNSSALLVKPQTQIPRKPKKFVVFANNPSAKEREEEKDKEEEIGFGGGDDDLRENQRPLFGNIRWGDLLLDPDPNNILAVGLTGLLTWASVQVLWQLVFIALAILVAAVKYSFIAAVLLFILIALL
ncbi:hypothetical protein PRUPE_2G086600 [Prunus persica]|uniref:Uncharacterized protein n=1 Tax=Prunus persica TaxID=3760 RepID=A0A251QD35_PRUPE|nr:hypothetical protein PRUPE_2G086600 [Prunus persica]